VPALPQPVEFSAPVPRRSRLAPQPVQSLPWQGLTAPLDVTPLPAPTSTSAQLAARLGAIRLLALDVDGTLTDGGIYYGPSGVEVQRFDVRDGLGLVMLRRAGVRLVMITGRGCPATARRARELGFDRYVPQSGPKDQVLAGLQTELGIAPEETLAMGDDLPDLPLFARAGFKACPSDATLAVRAVADWISTRPGGHGAVRELCDLLLASREPIHTSGARP
jgi:3-deoxy-D-manno-octulosonate 8-phosphate phosphatase (KDO 8-P phosphatase)